LFSKSTILFTFPQDSFSNFSLKTRRKSGFFAIFGYFGDNLCVRFT